jgi:predicted RNA-binding Zn ribbon-like protein
MRALPVLPLPAHPAGEERDGFTFRSERLCLDLAATLAARLKPEPRELLATPEDLGRWLVAAGLARQILHPSEEEWLACQALREALYRLAQASLRNEPLAGKDLAQVNRWAAMPPPVPQLSQEGIEWVGGGVGALLAAIARDGVELLGGPMTHRLRKCANPGCAILFVDLSRSNRRRWCSMAACGNKAKVGAFRRRLQEIPQ